MARKSIQEINFTSGQDHKGKFAPDTKSMPIVRCVCGAEILVVPDLKAMNCAIKNHVAEHKKTNSPERVSALGSLTRFLTEQVLIVASEINLSFIN